MKKKTLIAAAIVLPVLLIGGIAAAVEINYQKNIKPGYTFDDVPQEMIDEAMDALGDNVGVTVEPDGTVIFTGEPIMIHSNGVKDSSEDAATETVSGSDLETLIEQELEKVDSLPTPAPEPTPDYTDVPDNFEYTEENYAEPTKPAQIHPAIDMSAFSDCIPGDSIDWSQVGETVDDLDQYTTFEGVEVEWE